MLTGKKVKRVAVTALAFSVLFLPFVSGCAKHPSPEELTRLEEQARAADSAEKMLQQKKEEKARLEAQLSAKKAELEKLEARRNTVKANKAKGK